ncbi:hypothetical protein [Chitinophaga sp. LS1]|uniref:hypothetical protein n=1 Tax=Chitinophaga sp. LS1 TaxID=3051176 RepID=UPI002AABF246|nr:hypothetical protein [Chitinophaga sp. LS1]WPV66281.1 hypothetical protein QQL36_31275 [Chitinophaga sp. LS1]
MCQNNCSIASFLPKVSYTFDASAKTVAVQDGSTYGSGDGLKKVHIKVHDQFGNEKRDTITTTGSGGAKTIDVSTLNLSKPLNITATVITNKDFHADGSAFHIQAAGDLAGWDKK